MTFGSLFAGIGGFDLGLERAGMTCLWQCEIDPHARRVLERHWPDVRRWDDVRTFPPPDGDWGVDLICGGFPCQDISNLGTRSGLDGARSGLWSEFARIIGELRPRYVLVENVTAILHRGMGRVLGNLSEIGYDAEWSVVSACSMGATHTRERLFIIAYPDKIGREALADETIIRPSRVHDESERHPRKLGRAKFWIEPRPIGARPMGVGNGIPGELDRIGACGNAVVPQVAEWIGRRILEADGVTP